MDNAAKKSDLSINEINELRILEVFEVLEIGPIKIEKDRFIAPYTITKDGKKDSSDLIYSYEEEVFDPSNESHQNLVSMIAAQVAVNYGLFCKKIVFNGLYDSVDKKVIKECEKDIRMSIKNQLT